MSNIELYREQKALQNEQKMSERAFDFQKNFMKEKLLGNMGQDMLDVLEGKKVVKLTFKEKMKYKINHWVDKLLKLF